MRTRDTALFTRRRQPSFTGARLFGRLGVCPTWIACQALSRECSPREVGGPPPCHLAACNTDRRNGSCSPCFPGRGVFGEAFQLAPPGARNRELASCALGQYFRQGQCTSRNSPRTKASVQLIEISENFLLTSSGM